MKNIYVVSDIHGEYNDFLGLLEKIDLKAEDKMIILGDVVDRGPLPLTLLRFIMAMPNIEMILGNHERMLLDYLQSIGIYGSESIGDYYARCGGYSTIKELGIMDEKDKCEIEEYLKGLPLYKIIDDFILVHSGVNTNLLDRELPIKDSMARQEEEDLLWSREDFFTAKGIDNYTVIFGHTPTSNIRRGEVRDFSIWHDPIYKDKIGIDGGATFKEKGGRLACLRLRDRKEYYI